MSYSTSFDIIASGLSAQRLKMDLTSANLANIQTSKGPDGGVYKRLAPIFTSDKMEFDKTLSQEVNDELFKVKVSGIQKDQTPPRRVYDPGHPDADTGGYVDLPNINMMREMADLVMASRAYEANVTSFNTTKNMAMKALEIGKV